ncbi:MAG TPA: division/cell wall cluster transcriptional repressor MraZ [Acidimicrobiia bacterium]|nr:division/cell wall cluster transcriptional repressor MraZ [Acidimicrobiia bacterium]
MFLGEFQHSLDAKGRVILPAEFRDDLAEGAVITRGLDGCLSVYPREEFEAMAESVRDKSRRGDRERRAARTFFASAKPVQPDKQGRVAIPQNLREFAALERDVMVVGVDVRVELWDAQRWRDQDVAGQRDLAAAEGLSDFF